jgi:peptide-methionine (R)-S-oxide reductase
MRLFSLVAYTKPSRSLASSSATFISSATTMSDGSTQKSESEWKAILSPEQFRILRQKGTERPGTGEYEHHKEQGVYSCAGCGTPLYKSSTKFSSGCGWPAFFDGDDLSYRRPSRYSSRDTAIPGAVSRHEDGSLGMTRIEITCTACGGHLGHVFKGEKFPTPSMWSKPIFIAVPGSSRSPKPADERHCVNSVSLKFYGE